MFRRHFFLVIALVVIVLMAGAAVVKILWKKPGAGGAGGPVAASAPGRGGGPGGPGGAGGPGAGRGGGGRGAAVTPAVVRPRLFVDRLEVLGVAKGRQSVTLTSNNAEMVDRVLFRPGDRVRQGQVLIELRRTEEDASIAQAKAAVDYAKVNYERWNTLAKEGVAPVATADQYKSAWLQAQASLTAAQSRLADRVIRAPFSGVVGLSDIAAGALISPGTAIATLDDVSVIRADFDVPDRYLNLIREGGPLIATSDANPGERYSGRIAKLDTRIDERTRSFKVRAELPNPGGRLKPGMLLRVGIDRGTRMGLATPESSVVFSGGQAYVYVITPSGGGGVRSAGAPGVPARPAAPAGPPAGAQSAQGPQGGRPGGGQGRGGGMIALQRPILTGLSDCGFVEVREGLEAGERVVADGVNKISPNQPVTIAGGRGGPGGGRPGMGVGAAPGGAAASGQPAPGAATTASREGRGSAGAPGAMAGREGRGGPGAMGGRSGGGRDGSRGGRGATGGGGAGACANQAMAGRMGAGMTGGRGGAGGFPGGGRPGMTAPGGNPAQGGRPGMGGGRPGMTRGAAAAPQ